MNNIESFNLQPDTTTQINSETTDQKKEINQGYAFFKKVKKNLATPRNYLLLTATNLTGLVAGGLIYGGLKSVTIDKTCSKHDAKVASLLTIANTSVSSIICALIFAVWDACKSQEDNSSHESTDTTNNVVERNTNTQQNSLTENKNLFSNLSKTVKQQLVAIKNKLKNIEKFEAELFYVLLAHLMVIHSAIEYDALSNNSCHFEMEMISCILVPIMAFVLFSLPVLAIKKYERMPTD